MSREIGSEFCSTEHQKNDKKYFLSGRTALDYTIKDIKKNHVVRSVLLPSYCCYTMIEPFIKNGIAIRFYDVFPDEEFGLRVCIPEGQKYEIFYYMLYFGYTDMKGYNREDIRNQWNIIIEDKTHSWLSSYQPVLADYNYISYRKWTGFTGIASTEKQGGIFKEKCPEFINEEYCKLRTQAATMKYQYLAGMDIKKNEYLLLFNQAEELLENDYVGYRPSIDSFEKLLNLDKDFLKKRRRKNAQILINDLSEIPEVKLLFPNVREEDVPLFVPILIEQKREELRNYLISHNIYCPVHWPLSEYQKGLSRRALDIYGQELSLVCDQRYVAEDMKRIVKLLAAFFEM